MAHCSSRRHSPGGRARMRGCRLADGGQPAKGAALRQSPWKRHPTARRGRAAGSCLTSRRLLPPVRWPVGAHGPLGWYDVSRCGKVPRGEPARDGRARAVCALREARAGKGRHEKRNVGGHELRRVHVDGQGAEPFYRLGGLPAQGARAQTGQAGIAGAKELSRAQP